MRFLKNKNLFFLKKRLTRKDLPITQSEDGKYNWITPAKSDIGKKRKEWADKKGCSLGIKLIQKVFMRKLCFLFILLKKNLVKFAEKQCLCFIIIQMHLL